MRIAPNPSRSAPASPIGLRAKLSGVLHYWLPTMLVGTALKLRGFGRRGKRGERADFPRSILVLRLDHIGDLVLCSAMFRELRRHYPQARIAVVASSRTKELLEACPYVDEVIGKPTQPNSLRSVFRELGITRRFCKQHLAGRSFDVAMVPRWDTDTFFATLMCLYSNASERVAFTEKCSPEKRVLNWRFDAFYTKVLPPGLLKHEAARNLDVVRHVGAEVRDSSLEIWCTPSDHAYADRFLSEAGLSPQDQVFAFGIGSTNHRCQWPLERYAALIERLAHSEDYTPVVICGPDDALLLSELERHLKGKVLVPKQPSLRETCAILRRCRLFIGNDSGPLHMASAAGVPAVEISCHPADGDPHARHSPDRFGPFTKHGTVVRPKRAKTPCRVSCTASVPHCITDVTVEMVATVALALVRMKVPSDPYDLPAGRLLAGRVADAARSSAAIELLGGGPPV